MKKYKIVARALMLFSISSLSAEDMSKNIKKIQKKAFSVGINKSLMVMEHEHKQRDKKIKEGYCISIKNKQGTYDLSSNEVVKLESLSLYLKYHPSYFSRLNSRGKEEKLLCFDEYSKNKVQSLSKLRDIKDVYPTIDEYNPKVIRIFPTYKRILPSVGRYYSDTRLKVIELNKRLLQKDRKIFKLHKEIKKIKNKIKNMGKQKLKNSKYFVGDFCKNFYYKNNFSIIENNAYIKEIGETKEVYKDTKRKVKALKKNNRVIFIEKNKK